jgi:HAD superfamily hydrolase (TIGR01549 family)
MRIRGIIFDMDGTITAPVFDYAGMKAEANIGDCDVLEHMLRATGAERERIQRVMQKYEDAAAAKAKLNRGARTVLTQLTRLRVPMALLTRNSRRSVDTVCRKLRLKFDFIVTREDGPHKPAPDSILQIARQWGVSPREVLMVGDYKWDVVCAKNAGAPCVALVNGSGVPDWAQEADFVINRLTELVQIVEGEAPRERGVAPNGGSRPAAPRRKSRSGGRAGARPSKRRTA